MNIYLRKILEHDITHQISVTKEVLNGFFGVFDDRDSVVMHGKKSGQIGTVIFLLATDPRFGGDIKQIINSEGGMDENDILLFVRDKDSYIIEVIRSTDDRHRIFTSMMETQRHLIIHVDDIHEPQNSEDNAVMDKFARNRIVFGAPGTGKSYVLNEEKDLLLGKGSKDFERVTFHPDYSYANFVGTYKPVPCKDSNGENVITYKYVPGPFMRTLVKALQSVNNGTPKPFLLIIEEINRANVAAVFGDVFQLLDRDENGASEYSIQASEDIKKHLAEELGGSPDNYSEIHIPNNMYIWASMNSADQGVYPMDTAFKRRWNFVYLGIDNNASLIKGTIELGKGKHQYLIECNRLRKAINEKLTRDFKINEDKLLGPFFLSKNVLRVNDSDGKIANPIEFIESFKSKVIMYLYEDAAKLHRNKLFSGCDNGKYSSVCEAFDEIGIDIFGNDFRELYDQLEV